MATPSASRRKGGKRQENISVQVVDEEPLAKKAKIPDEIGKIKIKKEILEGRT